MRSQHAHADHSPKARATRPHGAQALGATPPAKLGPASTLRSASGGIKANYASPSTSLAPRSLLQLGSLPGRASLPQPRAQQVLLGTATAASPPAGTPSGPSKPNNLAEYHRGKNLERQRRQEELMAGLAVGNFQLGTTYVAAPALQPPNFGGISSAPAPWGAPGPPTAAAASGFRAQAQSAIPRTTSAKRAGASPVGACNSEDDLNSFVSGVRGPNEGGGNYKNVQHADVSPYHVENVVLDNDDRSDRSSQQTTSGVEGGFGSAPPGGGPGLARGTTVPGGKGSSTAGSASSSALLQALEHADHAGANYTTGVSSAQNKLTAPLASALSALKNKKMRPPAAPPAPTTAPQNAARRATLRSQERSSLRENSQEKGGGPQPSPTPEQRSSFGSPQRRGSTSGRVRSSSERRRRGAPGRSRDDRQRMSSVPPGERAGADTPPPHHHGRTQGSVPSPPRGGGSSQRMSARSASSANVSAASTASAYPHQQGGGSVYPYHAAGNHGSAASSSSSSIVLDTLRGELQRKVQECEEWRVIAERAEDEAAAFRSENERLQRELDTLRLEAKTWPKKLEHYRFDNERLRHENHALKMSRGEGEAGGDGGSTEEEDGSVSQQSCHRDSSIRAATTTGGAGRVEQEVDTGTSPGGAAAGSSTGANHGGGGARASSGTSTRKSSAAGPGPAGGGTAAASSSFSASTSSSSSGSKCRRPPAKSSGKRESPTTASGGRFATAETGPARRSAGAARSATEQEVVGAEDGAAVTSTSTSSTPAEQVEDTTESDWVFVIQGVDAGGEKKYSCYPDTALARTEQLGIRLVSLAGDGSADKDEDGEAARKGSRTINQDDFLLAMQRNPIDAAANVSSGTSSRGGGAAQHWLSTVREEGYIALYAVFDGFGPGGHHCSRHCKQRIAELVFSHALLFQEPQRVLQEACDAVQQELHAASTSASAEEGGTAASLVGETLRPGDGASAALALLLRLKTGGHQAAWSQEEQASEESWVVVGYIGDSRVVLASREENGSFGAVALTKDHKIATHKGEAARLQHRADVKPTQLTRHIGVPSGRTATCKGEVTGAGPGDFVETRAEVNAFKINQGQDLLLILGTKGLFQQFSNSALVSQLIGHGVDYLKPVCEKAREKGSGEDVTAIAISLLQ